MAGAICAGSSVSIGSCAMHTPRLLRRAPAQVMHRRPSLPCRPAVAARASAATVQAAQKKVFKSFEDMVSQSTYVLCDFYATYCGPCQMMSSIMDEVAPTLRDKVKFVKVDTQKYPSVASRYHIAALPTLVLFKNGQPVDRIEGVVMGEDLRRRLEYFTSQN